MRRATATQKALIIDILSKSFLENKSVNYVVKQDHKKEHRIRGLMDYSFNICNSYGDVWISDDAQACALILFSDKKRASLNTILWDIKLAFSVIGLDRVGK